MIKRNLILYSMLLSALQCFADYSNHGKPWDADDTYDSSRGLWFAILVLVVLVLVFVGAAAKNTWDNHKSEIKDGLGIVAFFGGCILLFFIGKSYFDSNHTDNTANEKQTQQPTTERQNDINSNASTRNEQQITIKYRTEYYDEKCPSCEGSGRIICPYCGGSARMATTCQSCNGSGKRVIHRTGQNFATGEWETFEDYDVCMNCLGKGVKETVCSYCKNDNYYGTPSHIACPNCQGRGVFHKSRQVSYY